jgi:hypothetical protein
VFFTCLSIAVSLSLSLSTLSQPSLSQPSLSTLSLSLLSPLSLSLSHTHNFALSHPLQSLARDNEIKPSLDELWKKRETEGIAEDVFQAKRLDLFPGTLNSRVNEYRRDLRYFVKLRNCDWEFESEDGYISDFNEWCKQSYKSIYGKELLEVRT